VVAVAIEPDVPAEHAVRWAAREAARRKAHLHVVLPNDDRRDRLPRDAFTRTLSAARRTAPGVVISAGTRRRARAARRTRRLDAFAHPHDTRPVVLAVGPSTPDEVLAFGFTQASVRHAGLLAAPSWNDPFTGLATLVSGRIARCDAADDVVRAELDQRLSAYTVAYPEVSVHTLVVEDRCAELLATLVHRARLIVLGTSARGRALNAISRSPALALAHNVPCPVAVVPVPSPFHRSWLPARPVGLSDLRT
jgi:nucleotide-binding universal stress UspA family protein